MNPLGLQPFLFLRCLQCRGWQGWTAQNCQRHFLHVLVHPSYSPSSSSNSPSSSAVASWYCWYSETKSFMLDSASVNSISSIPSPVYQCKKASQGNKNKMRKNALGKAAIASPRLTSSKTLVTILPCGGTWQWSIPELSWSMKQFTCMLLLSLYLEHILNINDFLASIQSRNKKTSCHATATRLNISWIAVELPANATAIFNPFGGMSQTDALMLLGIHSTK